MRISAAESTPSIYKKYLFFLGIVLAGYAILGKGFAYVGVPPLYIGEVALFAGILVLIRLDRWSIFKLPVTWALMLFMALGLLRTVTSFAEAAWSPIDVLRDSAVWFYGIFAIIVSSLILKLRSFGMITAWYSRWYQIFVFWSLFSLTFKTQLIDLIKINGTDLFGSFRDADAATHLAAVVSFMLLRLSNPMPPKWLSLLFWIMWIVAFLWLTSQSRAGFLAMASSLFILALFDRDVTRLKIGLSVAALILTFFVAANLDLYIDTNRGEVSANEIARNIETIIEDDSGNASGVGGGTKGEDGTRAFRQNWWSEIINYTLNDGEYFWTGKGFGINLADSDGFQVAEDKSVPLRSPHSCHMTVLARMGAPGFASWIIFILVFSISFFRSYLRTKSAKNDFLANLHLWLATYFCAMLINASFGVYLESPFGGIWFWCVVGAAMALIYYSKFQLGKGVARDSYLNAPQPSLAEGN